VPRAQRRMDGMKQWERFIWKARGPLRWVFRGGIVIWALFLLRELTAANPITDRAFELLICGGGGIYLLGLWMNTMNRIMPRLMRAAATRALLEDTGLSRAASREDVTAFLLGRDRKRMRLFPWAKRVNLVLDLLLPRAFSGQSPKSICETAMGRCLALLDVGRRSWGFGRFGRSANPPVSAALHERMKDEELLQCLFVGLLLISALYRLHLLAWGTPTLPFTRMLVSRLRRAWLPFCLLVPTARGFPPPLPGEMEKFLAQHPAGQPEEAFSLLASWLFQGGESDLARFMQWLLSSP
jgi:hypothetical protein